MPSEVVVVALRPSSPLPGIPGPSRETEVGQGFQGTTSHLRAVWSRWERVSLVRDSQPGSQAVQGPSVHLERAGGFRQLRATVLPPGPVCPELSQTPPVPFGKSFAHSLLDLGHPPPFSACKTPVTPLAPRDTSCPCKVDVPQPPESRCPA